MKRFGFTLAEVLITLAIIGVVSAITLPTLTSSTRNAQVGPKLAKAASMFEQATQAMLNENNVDSLESLNIRDIPDFINRLSDFMKLNVFNNNIGAGFDPVVNNGGAANGGCGLFTAQQLQSAGRVVRFQTHDGLFFVLDQTGLAAARNAADSNRPHKRRYATLYVDINGPQARPNFIGRDIFAFAMYGDGSLRPVGIENWYEGDANQCTWARECNETLNSGFACTGHIFANDLKILYR